MFDRLSGENCDDAIVRKVVESIKVGNEIDITCFGDNLYGAFNTLIEVFNFIERGNFTCHYPDVESVEIIQKSDTSRWRRPPIDTCRFSSPAISVGFADEETPSLRYFVFIESAENIKKFADGLKAALAKEI